MSGMSSVAPAGAVPVPPLRVLLPELPVSTLLSVLPVPLIAEVPVSVRFSTLAASIV